jgi:hypothetical protein
MLNDLDNGPVTQKAEALGSSQRLVQFLFDLILVHEDQYVSRPTRP